MYKRFGSVFLLLLLAVLMLWGCGSSQDSVVIALPTLQATESATEAPLPSIPESMVGTWHVAGMLYTAENTKEYVIDLNDNAQIKGLYHSYVLCFKEDSTFLYSGFLYYSYSGSVSLTSEDTYFLKTKKVLSFVTEIEGDSSKTSYIASFLDENTLLLEELDPNTGKRQVDSTPLLFLKENTESEYIKNNKTPIDN